MAQERTLVGIDIGNSKIRTVVAVQEDERNLPPNVIGVGIAPSAGLRKGAIVDLGETIQAITASLEDAERMSGEAIHHAVIAVGGAHLASQNSRGVVAVGHSGTEITADDAARAVEAAQTVNIPQNRKILLTIPQVYNIDDQTEVKDPVGMIGVRLEAEAHIITGLAPALKNLENAVHQSSVDVDDLIPAPLAAAEAVLDKRQKELGVVTIDIGAGSTGIAVYEEGVLLHTAVLPIGGDSVTNDIAIGLRTSVDTAEKLKIEYGTVNLADANSDMIDLSALSRAETQSVSKRELAQICEARYSEIFEMIRSELQAIDRDGQLPAGVMLTGGASKIPGLLELARETLKLPVQIGFPTGIDGMIDRVDDPSFATVIGLIRFGAKGSLGHRFHTPSLNLGKAADGLKKFLRKLLP